MVGLFFSFLFAQVIILLDGRWGLDDTKGVIRSRKSKDRQYNGQKDKQWSTKHYAEN